jgi:hypothetical protein
MQFLNVTNFTKSQKVSFMANRKIYEGQAVDLLKVNKV